MNLPHVAWISSWLIFELLHIANVHICPAQWSISFQMTVYPSSLPLFIIFSRFFLPDACWVEIVVDEKQRSVLEAVKRGLAPLVFNKRRRFWRFVISRAAVLLFKENTSLHLLRFVNWDVFCRGKITPVSFHNPWTREYSHSKPRTCLPIRRGIQKTGENSLIVWLLFVNCCTWWAGGEDTNKSPNFASGFTKGVECIYNAKVSTWSSQKNATLWQQHFIRKDKTWVQR
jgi:hypothetical protein